jgi:hypothetical protein
MSDLDVVLERLFTDPAFARELSSNPTKALAGYELTGEDLSTLSTQVSFDRGSDGLVEDRISKAGMFGLLSTMAEGVSGLAGGTTGLGGPDTAPAGIIILDEPDPGVIDPNQAPGDELAIHDVEEGPEESVGFHDVEEKPTESVGYHEVDEKPTESVGIHEVDEQPAPDDVSIHEVDQPAPDDPQSLVGFNPQPDPPGSRG